MKRWWTIFCCRLPIPEQTSNILIPVKTFFTSGRLSLSGAPDSGPELENLTDEELMVEYSRQTNLRAFNLLYQRYRTVLFGYLLKWSCDRQQAEDLYQDIFLRVIRHASDYQPKALFRTWLFTIARNILKDQARKRDVRKVIISHNTHFTSEDLDGVQTAPDFNPGPHQLAESREIQLILLDALNTLPSDQREMFLLREEAGLDFNQAAMVARCSLNTAKSRMRYALIKIRDSFEKKGLLSERTVQP
jgi:RNA polymerase sigma-70 factor, ECF subfamily